MLNVKVPLQQFEVIERSEAIPTLLLMKREIAEPLGLAMMTTTGHGAGLYI